MENFLISAAMVVAVILFVLMLIGAAMMLGKMFWGTVQRLTRRSATAAERDIAKLLAETDPDRR